MIKTHKQKTEKIPITTDYKESDKQLPFYIQNSQNCIIQQNIMAVDEVIIKFRGKVVFQQYIPKTHKRFGIKIYKLCDRSGYNTT
jgi:hypothetical protein